MQLFREYRAFSVQRVAAAVGFVDDAPADLPRTEPPGALNRKQIGCSHAGKNIPYILLKFD